MNRFSELEEKVMQACEAYGASQAFLLTDSNVDVLASDFLPSVPRLVVRAGEESKSVEGAARVWNFLVEKGALRRSVLINLGGGMISDLGGFAASTFKRGIACINLPTTLLAAVDASIGGKTGINFAGLKNEVGTFALPLAVFPVSSLFSSLSDEEWLSGVGEAIKTGLLCSESLYNLAVSPDFIVKREPSVVSEVVSRCAAFKQMIVEEDFREKGKRRILNLGHTTAHAIEAFMLARGETVPHGIAVAHGLLDALKRSREQAGLPAAVVENYEKVLHRFFPPLNFSEADRREIEAFMVHDKKNRVPGQVEWVLLKRIGEAI